MTHPVRLDRHGSLGLIVINNPPVNALSAAVRQGIEARLREVLGDDSLSAVLLVADGRTFPAGADITEFSKPPQAPLLPDLCNMIEASPKPVVVALHGTVLGGGLELAMAAHYRVADENTLLGLPEVKLGILPGAGGTQRTPRLVGIKVALDMMLSGLPIKAADAERLGLIDEISPMATLRGDAADLAGEVGEVRRTRDARSQFLDGATCMADIAARRSVPDRPLASRKIIDCVEAALLVPFEVGIEMERDAFVECLASDASVGLRHAFFAERSAGKFPELLSAVSKQVDTVGVVGGGLMGSGIAIACLDAGFAVTVVEQGEDGVTGALNRIGALYEKGLAKGQMGEGALTDLNLTTEMEALGSADIIIECASEDAEIKQGIFAKLGQVAKPDAVLASNTSYLDLEPLTRASGRAADVVAMHFFAPAHRMALVEIGVPETANAQAVATTHALAKALGKTPVRSAAAPGLIGNQMLTAYRATADRLLLRGAQPAQVDAAMRSFGMPMGPYEAQDYSGLDIAWARRKAMKTPDPEALLLPDILCEAGQFGRKAGKGYYVYDSEGKRGAANPEMLTMLLGERRMRPMAKLALTPELIQDHLIAALINAGAGLLEAGTVARPSDIDVVMVHGFGFPRHKGGPMHQGDMLSTFEVARRITEYAQTDSAHWRISPLLARLAAERMRFSQYQDAGMQK